jgi:hypothetical protein
MSYFSKNRFSLRQVVLILTIVFIGIAVLSYATVTIPNTFTSGTTISSSQVNANFAAVKEAIDPLQVSNYTGFACQSTSAIDVTTTDTQLNIGTKSFTKSRSDTNIEVHVNTRFSGGTFSGGATGIAFWVMIDGTIDPTFDNHGSIRATNTSEFQSIYAVFQGLPAGPHTVSLWAHTNGGSTSGVGADPGGWSGAIIVKESH